MVPQPVGEWEAYHTLPDLWTAGKPALVQLSRCSNCAYKTHSQIPRRAGLEAGSNHLWPVEQRAVPVMSGPTWKPDPFHPLGPQGDLWSIGLNRNSLVFNNFSWSYRDSSAWQSNREAQNILYVCLSIWLSGVGSKHFSIFGRLMSKK